jgi:hypothetical protein
MKALCGVQPILVEKEPNYRIKLGEKLAKTVDEANWCVIPKFLWLIPFRGR